MNSILNKIENKYGKLPLLYEEMLLNNVVLRSEYNQSNYLQWCNPEDIINESYNKFENDLRAGLLMIGICGQEAFWFLDMHSNQRVLRWQNDEADLYAPSIEGLIFRVCIDLACGFYEEEREITFDSIMSLISLIYKSKPNWHNIIIEIMKKPVRLLKYYECLIEEPEAEEILLKEFGTEYINGTVKVLKESESDS